MSTLNWGCSAEQPILNNQMFFKIPKRLDLSNAGTQLLESNVSNFDGDVRTAIKAYAYLPTLNMNDIQFRIITTPTRQDSCVRVGVTSPLTCAFFKAKYPNEFQKLLSNPLLTQERVLFEFGIPNKLVWTRSLTWENVKDQPATIEMPGCGVLPSNTSSALVNYLKSHEYQDILRKIKSLDALISKFRFINVVKTYVTDPLDALGVQINQYPNFASFYPTSVTESESRTYKKYIDDREAPILNKWVNSKYNFEVSACTCTPNADFYTIAYLMFSIYKAKGSIKLRNKNCPIPLDDESSMYDAITSLKQMFELNVSKINTRSFFVDIFNSIFDESQQREYMLGVCVNDPQFSKYKTYLRILILCSVLSKSTEFENIIVKYCDWAEARKTRSSTSTLDDASFAKTPETEIKDVALVEENANSNTSTYLFAFLGLSAVAGGTWWWLHRRKNKASQRAFTAV